MRAAAIWSVIVIDIDRFDVIGEELTLIEARETAAVVGGVVVLRPEPPRPPRPGVAGNW